MYKILDVIDCLLVAQSLVGVKQERVLLLLMIVVEREKPLVSWDRLRLGNTHHVSITCFSCRDDNKQKAIRFLFSHPRQLMDHSRYNSCQEKVLCSLQVVLIIVEETGAT